MDGKKIYQIQINGVQESINAVNSLNKQLDALESKINALQSKNVNINAGGGSKSSSTSSLSEEEKIARQIEQIDAKRIAYSKEIYQNYLAAKDVLKETVKDQQQIAATERLQADNYTNTMAGMKQELADIKSVMQTVDLGDTDQFDKMTQRAKELNDKLKEIDQSYGQFGRNVGNYAEGVAEGISKVKVNVGGTVREFDNARQATKTLNNELKAMAMNGQQDTKAFKDLRQAVLQMESTMNDAKKPMDNLMDTMESFTAVASVSKGFSAFFGVDDSKIQQNIQKLLALQTALKGLQTISKQMQTREGLGLIFGTFSTQVDKATAKLLVFNRALLGTSKASKVAAVGVKTLGKAIKGVVSLGIMLAIDLAIEGLEKLWNWFNKDKEEAKKLAEENKKLGETYANAASKLKFYELKVRQFNGTRQQEKNLVEDLNREFGSQLGTYKTLAKWKEILITKGQAYCRMLVMEAKVQALATKAAEAYVKFLEQRRGGNPEDMKKAFDEYAKFNQMLEKEMKGYVNFQQSNGIGDFADQIDKNTKNSEDALKKGKEELDKTLLAGMKDSLAKELKQLEINHEKEIASLKKNKKAIKAAEERYALERQKIIDDYFKKVQEQIENNAEKINTTGLDIVLGKLNAELEDLQNKFDALSESRPKIATIQTSSETKEMLKKTTSERVKNTSSFMYYENDFASEKKHVEEYYEFLNAYVEQQQPKVREFIKGELSKMEKDSEDYYNYIATLFKANHQNEINLLSQFGGDEKKVLDNLQKAEETSLSDSLNRRLQLIENYSTVTRSQLIKNIEHRSQLLQTANQDEMDKALIAEKNAFETLQKPLLTTKENLEHSIEDFKVTSDKDKEILNKLKDDLKNINDQIDKNSEQHEEKLATIVQDGANKQDKIIMDSAKQKSQVYEDYWNEILDTYSEVSQKVSNITSRGGVIDNIWGIVNITKTKKELKDAETATLTTLNRIQGEKAKLDTMMAMGLITPEIRNKILQQLNQEEMDFKNFIKNIQEAQGQVIPQFVQSCQAYVNAAMDSFNTIMNAVWNAQDTAFDKEQEEIDKANEALEKALDKQQEIIEEHKNAIDSIEDELSSARGDRRQRLIDQLNAEVAAQRAAQKEEAKIKKQQEAQERKQEALEKKRKEAEFNRQILQAVVNGAMSVTYAAMNNWPVPAIPLMALAASATAAQIAIMKANKPYLKEGGVLEGPAHSQGGVKVYGGYAELEGHEYIVNKRTTIENEPLLEYINSKKKRLDLNDMIDFFSNGKVKSNIKRMIPSNKYADGGLLAFNNNINYNDRLLDSFERYANRPVYVAVTEIESKMGDVNNVRVLAGLKPS